LLGAFFAIGEGLTDEEVEEAHEVGEGGVLSNTSICDIKRDKVNSGSGLLGSGLFYVRICVLTFAVQRHYFSLGLE
jgi:hypothetical protein